MSVPLAQQLYGLLRCPCDHGTLENHTANVLICRSCGASFPVRDGVPVLINASNSLFSTDRLILDHNPAEQSSALKKLARAVIPDISLNVSSERNYGHFRKLLLEQSSTPLVLIIGSGDVGSGLRELLRDPAITFVATDVYFGTRVSVIADGHDLPFADGSFDAAICQAVLEHVLDPYRCVSEIHRVLKPAGLVYAETPFMQQVHEGPYDFTRFSLLGHRRLFRNFDQEIAGIACGPGMALAWATWYFLRSFSPSARWNATARTITSCTLFWLKYFDRWLATRPISSDAASAVFFLGRRSSTALPDLDLIKLHWSITK